jgi:outer membrane biosynthesis protein TonB
MSLILDALNRSRQESEQVPGLSSVHPVEDKTIDMSWLPWLLVCALALAVLAIGWLLFDRAPQPQPAPAVPTAAITPAPATPQQAPAPTLPEKAAVSPQPAAPAGRQARPADEAPAPTLPETAAVSPQPAAPAGKRALPPEHAPAPEQPVAAPVDASVAALYRQREQAPAVTSAPQQAPAEKPAAPTREEQAIDLEHLVKAAQEELADARLSESDVPFLSALSQQTKDAVPTIMYLRHDYSGDSAGSSVVLNGKTLHTGGSVGGIKVEEILPDSVVLEYQGNRFRLRALNSWVNL